MILGFYEFLCISMPSLWIPLAGCLAWVILLLSPQHSLQHLPSLSSLALCKSRLACPHFWVTHTLFCLFLIWADKCSLEEKSPNSAIRVHYVFILLKSDLGPQGLFQIFYLLLIAPHFPHGVWVGPDLFLCSQGPSPNAATSHFQ